MSVSRKVLILRGPSGCGKSTRAQHIQDTKKYCGWRPFTVRVVSADQFFINVDTGEYEFNPLKIGEAHADCLSRFIEILGTASSETLLIVDNTNIHRWEFHHYVEAARLGGWDVSIEQFVPRSFDDAKLCIKRNQHKVPADVILRMCNEFEPGYGVTYLNKSIDITDQAMT